MRNITLLLSIFVLAASGLIFSAFRQADPLEESITFVRRNLASYYDGNAENRLIRKYELNFTNTGFCRYKRYFHNGKTEYFAFNLSKFTDLDYYGSTSSGVLYLRTRGDDVIVQTHNDRSGDVDSMANFMILPIKNIEAEQLNELRARLTMTCQHLAMKK
ncbi:hypothetical protein C7T94_18815 [Pedobacter yulinensis]|uniref:Uncharacterized protein n=1 Tax=Pedobacter yulinensis TaxID=2126353 RepID=A0A2T3HGU9_9SPHI|nr:hypothetical protein [Pedobacter yulinensis]PST81667.1 hypothetical protein C7T94_18815 [Pedobacter yulinensis]